MDRIIVVGGGPAGMMAAIAASGAGNEVILVEKNNKPGKKLLVSGSGRCNITNACAGDILLTKYNKHGDFLRDAVKIFSREDLLSFFEERGLSFTEEDNGKIFPLNGTAVTIRDVLIAEMENRRVKVINNTEVTDFLLDKGVVSAVKMKNAEAIPCEKVVVAAGGAGYSATGSDGKMCEVIRKLGHTVEKLRPAIVAIDIGGSLPRILEGLALRDVLISFLRSGKKGISRRGDVLFTRKGISGPAVLNMSGDIVEWLDEGQKVEAVIDMAPDVRSEEFEKEFLTVCEKNKNKDLRNLMGEMFPERVCSAFLDLARIDGNKKVNQVTQEERRRVMGLVKSLRMDVAGHRSFDEAVVTRGGISLKEIDPKTMMSRLIKGLYFAGEMINIDGETGGFNLQAAFSTGYLAGKSASEM
ncbi:MAG TPA: NAD(P)/FAD-dependent oxidoreductase [Candidatus Omnitrophota bacterium]|nr:NAD(P)/FAD-dependent oxidoreductase [Candidatus Omnitrophota bacterium]HPS19748.1 NAD(P)/FAD-dependent oxidoreductase [Candidatus Omnitrophota bacterium]